MDNLHGLRINTHCGLCTNKCCSQPFDWVYLADDEISRISIASGLAESEFVSIAENPATGDKFKLLILPCKFLNETTGMCSIYDARPLICRLFPFYPEPLTGTVSLLAAQCGPNLEFLSDDNSDGWSLASHQLDIRGWLRDFWSQVRNRNRNDPGSFSPSE